MRRTVKGNPWRGLPLLVALLALSANVVFLACDEDGPSPIGDHLADDVDSGGETPADDAAAETGADAESEAGEDPDTGAPPVEAGTDSGDAGDAGDAGKKKDADAS